MNLTYTEPKNGLSLVSELTKLNDRICVLKKEIANKCNLKLIESQDARLLFLNTIQKNIMACNAILNLYIYVNKRFFFRIQDILAIPQLYKIPKEKKREEDQEIIFSFLRLSFIDSLFFNIENFFSNIKNARGLADIKSAYWTVVSAVLKDVNLQNRDDLFMTLSHIRNSLHNNGIHRKDTKNFNFNGITYSFKQNEKIECASWHHILNLLDCMLPVIQNILNHPNVIKIRYIPDDFAKELESPQLIDA